MMIPASFKLCAFAALLAAAGSPALAEGPGDHTSADSPPAVSDARSDSSARSRRVELPFPLESRTPQGPPRAPAASESDGPHPYREIRLQRASLDQAGLRAVGPAAHGLSHGAELG